MLKSIVEAAKNFTEHQIRSSFTLKKSIDKKTRTLIAFIDIEREDDKKCRVYVAADEAFVQKVAELFLEEQESDAQTLQDMILETANLIVGSAKVLAQESDDINFTIKTPHFDKVGEFDLAYDDAAKIVLDAGDEMIIAIKELDA